MKIFSVEEFEKASRCDGAAIVAEVRDDAIKEKLDGEELVEIDTISRGPRAGEMVAKWANDFKLAEVFQLTTIGRLVYLNGEKRYYQFDGRFWSPIEQGFMIGVIRTWLHDEAKEKCWPRFEKIATKALARSIEEYLQGLVNDPGFFEVDTRATKFSSVFENGTLEVSREGMKWMPSVFRSSDRLRNLIPVEYNPEAECPEFTESVREIFDPQSWEDDLRAYLMMIGGALIGMNRTSRLLIFEGESRSGKSSLSKLPIELIGTGNTMTLRTKLLAERFELFSFVGRLLLIGADVSENFLSCDGADVVKQLVGGDMLYAERKSGDDRVSMTGTFSIIITTNCELKVKDQGDADAWRVRLIKVPCVLPKNRKAIPFWEKYIVQKEGAGICRVALEEVVKFLAAGESFKLAEVQQARVDDLLNLSNPLDQFLADHVTAVEGSSVLKSAMKESYGLYLKDFGQRLPHHWLKPLEEKLSKRFNVSMSGSVSKPDGGTTRGWRGIELVE